MTGRQPLYFIFAANDIKKGLSAEAIARQCLELGAWGFRNRPKHGGAFSEGDKVAIYLAGVKKNAQSFIAVAELAGSCVSEPLKFGEVECPFSVQMRNIEILPEPLSIRPIRSRFQFITNQKNWGAHLFGGGAKIPEADFNLICSERKL